MKAQEVKLMSYLSDVHNHFEIPLFQRNYCWKRQQVEQLIEDIIEISKKEFDHYLGSFLLFKSHKNFYEIIDGQQRFMTLTLLIRALLSFSTKDANIINKQKKIKSMILTIDGNVKLKPQSVDEEEFLSIMLESYAKGNTSYLGTAYDVCLDAIESEEEFSLIYNGLDKLVVVLTVLDQNDQNKQTIFEKMNTLGVDLTMFDMVRNQLFFKIPSNQNIEYFYKTYWLEIEKHLVNQSKDDFMSVYIDSKSEADLSSDNKKYKLFVQLTDLYLNKHQDLTNLFKDILLSAKIYSSFKPKNGFQDDKISYLLANFYQLKVNSVYPFIMSILRYFYSSKEESTSLETTLETLLIYMVRSLASDNMFTFSKSNYQIFKLLDKQGYLDNEFALDLEIKDDHDILIGYGGKVIRYIYRFLGMPSDYQIKENISKVSFNTGAKGRYFIALNNHLFSKYVTDTLPKVAYITNNKNYSQRLGNLKISNETILEEIKYDNKEISAIQMINDRENDYISIILNKFPIGYNLFKKSQKIVVKITASLDFSKVNLTGFKINRFGSMNTSKFSDLYRDVLNFMFKRNPMQFVEWADINKNFTETGDSYHISFNKEKMSKFHTLRYKNRVIYVNMTLSANQMIRNAVAILDQNVKNVSLSINL